MLENGAEVNSNVCFPNGGVARFLLVGAQHRRAFLANFVAVNSTCGSVLRQHFGHGFRPRTNEMARQVLREERIVFSSDDSLLRIQPVFVLWT
jgi:hypothetical protein